jgi:OTU domain-containing protein 6
MIVFGEKTITIKLSIPYLQANKDDFQPFLLLSDEEFVIYCDKMANTPKWGGQVEITALSKALKRPIEVIQAEGPLVQVGEERHKGQPPIILTYHRHYYGLGEHYNSTKPIS